MPVLREAVTGWYVRPSTRKATLPDDWEQLRAATFRRDRHRCQHVRYDTGKKCLKRATDCDHVGDRNDHRIENLQSLCSWHHKQKTSSQGGTAAAARRKQPQKQKHPGIV